MLWSPLIASALLAVLLLSYCRLRDGTRCYIPWGIRILGWSCVFLWSFVISWCVVHHLPLSSIIFFCFAAPPRCPCLIRDYGFADSFLEQIARKRFKIRTGREFTILALFVFVMETLLLFLAFNSERCTKSHIYGVATRRFRSGLLRLVATVRVGLSCWRARTNHNWYITV